MAESQIIVVEDEALIALAIQRQLLRWGYGVPAMIASGEEAVQKAGEIRPDLVLMDIRLQGKIDGIEAAGQIYARFGIPTVYLSALSDGATVLQAKSAHSFGYVSKPINEAQLRSAIETALREHEMEERGHDEGSR